MNESLPTVSSCEAWRQRHRAPGADDAQAWARAFDQWLADYREFRRLETAKIDRVDEPEAVDRFFHRSTILELLLRAGMLDWKLNEFGVNDIAARLAVWVQALQETWEIHYPAHPVPPETAAMLDRIFA